MLDWEGNIKELRDWDMIILEHIEDNPSTLEYMHIGSIEVRYITEIIMK